MLLLKNLGLGKRCRGDLQEQVTTLHQNLPQMTFPCSISCFFLSIIEREIPNQPLNDC